MKLANRFPHGDTPMAVLRMERQDDHHAHSHDFTELVVVTGGRGSHGTETESWPISSGDVFVIHPTMTHSYHNTEDLELVNVIFQDSRLQLPARELSGLPGYIALFTLEPAWRNRHGIKSRLRLSVKDLVKAEEIIDNL